MIEVQNTINSDVSISCSSCGSMFSGQAKYFDEVLKMFIGHWLEIHNGA